MEGTGSSSVCSFFCSPVDLVDVVGFDEDEEEELEDRFRVDIKCSPGTEKCVKTTIPAICAPSWSVD